MEKQQAKAERPAGQEADGSRRDKAGDDQPGASPDPEEQEEEEEEELEPFVNRGLEIWRERQREWRAGGGGQDAFLQLEDRRKRKRSYTPTVSVEQLLSMQPLPHSVPLEEAVEVLAELWESEEPF